MATTPDPKNAIKPVTYIDTSAHTYAGISDKITDMVLKRPVGKGWLTGLGIGSAGLSLLICAIMLVLIKGVGVWGINQPVGWGFDIINFVWWIGIGHAGTLISAILLLLKQQWRTSINRFAEAMTLFAVACAGIFPILHLGRHAVFYWLFPYPNTFGLWPQFRSPLLWDVFAVSTYATVSLLFWYVGLIPDLATMRDRAQKKFAKVAYGVFALGWRGSALHWSRYETAYLLLAGLATPLVLSVHTIVGLDFAVSVIPGWHATIFPPYFVAGAIFAGFAMVITLAVPLRHFYGMHDFITMKHFDNMAKVILATGLMVSYGYFMEAFFGWYSANTYERFMIWNRMTGPYAVFYWALILCNFLAPQLFWFKKCRTNLLVLFVVSQFVNVGMWLERFIIIVTSLHRDYLPSSWNMYWGTFWDWATFIGTMGLFVTLFFLFIRLLPAISMFEMQMLLKQTRDREKAAGEKH